MANKWKMENDKFQSSCLPQAGKCQKNVKITKEKGFFHLSDSGFGIWHCFSIYLDFEL